LLNLQLSAWEIVRLAGASENHFVGVPCGLLDPFASVFGTAGHAMLLDCQSFAFHALPLNTPGHEFRLYNTGVRHALAAGAYATRVQECRQALAQVGHDSFRRLTLADVVGLPQTLAARARHVITENARVKHFVEALTAGDCQSIGRILSASHDSLRDDYEVSCKALDFLATQLCAMPGVAGARMMGGGFGGCVLALVESGKFQSIDCAIRSKYQSAFGTAPEIYAVQASTGAESDFLESAFHSN
jgi:galactokinase